MHNQLAITKQKQKPLFAGRPSLAKQKANIGQLLGNRAVQSDIRHLPALAPIDRPIETIAAIKPETVHPSRSSKLETLKREKFTPQNRAERVARSLAVLNMEVPINLSCEEWQQIAEDPDLEDQF